MGLVAGIGIQFGVLVSFGAFAGKQLDEKLASSWCMPLGVALGSIAAFVNMLWMLRYLERINSKGSGPQTGAGSTTEKQSEQGYDDSP